MLGLTLAVQLALEHSGLAPAPLNRACLTQLLLLLLAFIGAALLQSEALHASVPRDNRGFVALAGVFFAVVAMVVLGVARPRPLAIDTAAAAAELAAGGAGGWLPGVVSGSAGGGAAAALLKDAAAWLARRAGLGGADGAGVAVALAFLVAAPAALLLGPAWRYGRLLSGAVAAPRAFEAEYASLPGWRRALAMLGYALNLGVIALWVSNGLVLGLKARKADGGEVIVEAHMP